MLTIAVCLAPGVDAHADVDMQIFGIHAVPRIDYREYGDPSIIGGDGGDAGSGGEVVSNPVDLNGLSLWAEVMTGDWYCVLLPALPDGQTYTLVATTGGLTGAFANAPEGGVVRIRRWSGRDWCWPEPTMGLELHYHDDGPVQTVTGTIVDGSPAPVTYTKVSADPWWSVEVNQPTTITARVDVSSGTTSGLVSFSAGKRWSPGRPLDCPDVHVVAAVNAPATATCQGTFEMADTFDVGSPSPTATFTPDDPASAQGSYGRDFIGLHRGTTTTRIRSSRGQLVATVTPTYTGPFVPTGSVSFLADGVPIPGCDAALLVGIGGSSATCDPCRLPAGTHEISASYTGDENFDGSASDPQALPFAPAAPDPLPSPPPHETTPPSPPPPIVAIAPSASPHAVASRSHARSHRRAHRKRVRPHRRRMRHHRRRR